MLLHGYSANTDRDYILSIMGDCTNLTDPEKFSDLFEISVEGGINIRFRSVANSSTTEVYPTVMRAMIKMPMPKCLRFLNPILFWILQIRDLDLL